MELQHCGLQLHVLRLFALLFSNRGSGCILTPSSQTRTKILYAADQVRLGPITLSSTGTDFVSDLFAPVRVDNHRDQQAMGYPTRISSIAWTLAPLYSSRAIR